MGEDETEAGRQALWLLRDEGIDIRVTQQVNRIILGTKNCMNEHVTILVFLLLSPQTVDTSDTTREAEGDEEDVPSTLKTLKGILEQMHPKTHSHKSQKHW